MGDETVSTWVKFFKDAGIPSGLGATYSVIFCDHRIQNGLLGELTREILVEMGIKAMGDVIAILKHAKKVAQQVSRENTTKLLEAKSLPSKGKAVPAESSSPVKLEVSANELQDPSVFARLGTDAVDTKSAGVFKRLGEPIVTTTTTEEGPVKRDDSLKIHRRPISSSNSSSEDAPQSKGPPSKKVAVKRKHVLDRLGPESESQVKKASSSMRSSIQRPGVRSSTVTVVQLPPDSGKYESDSSSSSSEEENEVKEAKIVRLSSHFRAVEKNLVVTKVLKPDGIRSSNVLDRLGSSKGSIRSKPTAKRPALASSARSTKSNPLSTSKRTLAMDSEPTVPRRQTPRTWVRSVPNISAEKKRPRINRVLAMDSEPAKVTRVTVKPFAKLGTRSGKTGASQRSLAMDAETTSPVKRLQLRKNEFKSNQRTTSNLARKSLSRSGLSIIPSSSKIKLRVSRRNIAKPISSDFVSSTTSAGLFKGNDRSNGGGSVFERLGS